jgi:GLPGLI family protein
MLLFFLFSLFISLNDSTEYTSIKYRLTFYDVDTEHSFQGDFLQFYDDSFQLVLGSAERYFEQSSAQESFEEMKQAVVQNPKAMQKLREMGYSSDDIVFDPQKIKQLEFRSEAFQKMSTSYHKYAVLGDSIYEWRRGFEEEEVLVQPKKVMDWQIDQEQKEINGYVCQRATLQYFGHAFEAWFTLELPISAAPQIFHGLPGLVVQLKSMDGSYQYDFLELQKQQVLPISYRFDEKNRIGVVSAVRKQVDYFKALKKEAQKAIRNRQRMFDEWGVPLPNGMQNEYIDGTNQIIEKEILEQLRSKVAESN